MITDKIENISLYSDIPDDVKNFVLNINRNIDNQRICLSEVNFANIDSYYTKSDKDILFEAHKKYADVQLLLAGKEDIYYTAKSDLSVKIPYDKNSDCEFYKQLPFNYSKISLDGSNFAVFFPHEAHAPQASSDGFISKVKKVVVKIKV